MNKKALAYLLSKIKTFKKAKVSLEQYPTEPEIAAEVLWDAYMQGSIEKKTIADLGCGTGTFGIGALVLGAKNVYFVDIDEEALSIAKENLKVVEIELGMKLGKASFRCKDIRSFNIKVDCVIQNPPFGVKRSHTDKLFLLKAMSLADEVYTFHKLATKSFVNSIAEDHGFSALSIKKLEFPLKRSYWFHLKNIYYVDVGVWHLKKKV
ncbi:MAG: METTL5 family protein [Candidatus Woesearchaeota archaeon]